LLSAFICKPIPLTPFPYYFIEGKGELVREGGEAPSLNFFLLVKETDLTGYLRGAPAPNIVGSLRGTKSPFRKIFPLSLLRRGG
jgi:hypothetical protein